MGSFLGVILEKNEVIFKKKNLKFEFGKSWNEKIAGKVLWKILNVFFCFL